MKIEVIAIADEVLKGMIVNTNSAYISKAITQMGYSIHRHTVLSDAPKLLKEGLQEALKRSDILIATGGLGPTLDDVTRSVAAEIFSSELAFSERVANDLSLRFGKDLSTLKDQATVPTKATILCNDIGTAPGFIFEENGKILILMPGVPKEMCPMFDRYVISYLDRCLAHQERRYVETLYLCCINENKLDPILRQLSIAFPSVEIGIYPGYGSVSISLRGKKRDEVTEVKKTIEDSFSSYMYLAEHGRIEEAVFACMQEKKKTLSLAESCTGGLMAHKITALAGASNFFLGSVVCYSNAMKQDILNVRLSTLKSYGAVSRQAVVEMVEGLLSTTPCDIAIAVSGVAGPSGGTPDKPVGTVWFAIGERGLGTYASKLELKGVRDTIILSATNRILGTLYRKLKYGVEIEESF